MDRMFLSGFIGPYIVSLFVVEFVLIMQYLWKVIDDILGNGYGMADYMELIISFGVALLPLALPLTVLLSSVMIYGDKAEKYELSSLKSSGVSLNRMLLPGLWVALFTMTFSIVASNFLKPYANERYHKKIRDMKTNKLTFVFQEKIFNQEFKNFSIRVEKIHKDGRTLEGILIYDHSDNDRTILNVTGAKSGEMYTSRDGKYLFMDLKDGYQVKELRSELSDKTRVSYKQKARPVNRFEFASLRKSFELAKLLNLSITNLSSRQYDMMNTFELLSEMDSLDRQSREIAETNVLTFNVLNQDSAYVRRLKASAGGKGSKSQIYPRNNTKRKTAAQKALEPLTPQNMHIDLNQFETNPDLTSIVELYQPQFRAHIIDNGLNSAESAVNLTNNKSAENKHKVQSRKKYELRLHQQYSWALVCLIFLFIGAPAGALIRKGGFGYPLIIATVFYVTFIMLSIAGERMARTSMDPVLAAWLPCLVLIPFAVYLTLRAINDVPFFNLDISTVIPKVKSLLSK